MNQSLRKTLAFLVATSLSLCSYVALSKTLKNIKSLDENEIVLVGRIEPPA